MPVVKLDPVVSHKVVTVAPVGVNTFTFPLPMAATTFPTCKGLTAKAPAAKSMLRSPTVNTRARRNLMSGFFLQSFASVLLPLHSDRRQAYLSFPQYNSEQVEARSFFNPDNNLDETPAWPL